MLELFEFLKPRGRSIPLNTHWGDFGYMEMCVECNTMHKLASWCREQRIPYLSTPGIAWDDKETATWFQYVYDPDGIPIEAIGTMPK